MASGFPFWTCTDSVCPTHPLDDDGTPSRRCSAYQFIAILHSPRSTEASVCSARCRYTDVASVSCTRSQSSAPIFGLQLWFRSDFAPLGDTAQVWTHR